MKRWKFRGHQKRLMSFSGPSAEGKAGSRCEHGHQLCINNRALKMQRSSRVEAIGFRLLDRNLDAKKLISVLEAEVTEWLLFTMNWLGVEAGAIGGLRGCLVAGLELDFS